MRFTQPELHAWQSLYGGPQETWGKIVGYDEKGVIMEERMEDKTGIMEPAEEARAAEGPLSDEAPAGARPISRRTAVAAAAAIAAVVVIGGAACASASAQPEAPSPQQAASSQAASSRQGGGSSSSSSSGSASAASSEASEPGTGGEEAGGSGPAQDAQGAQESGAGRQEAARSQQGGGTSGGGGEPAKQRVWVVDQPATTQTIHHDAVMTQEDGGAWVMCTVCGADVTDDPAGHAEQHALAGVTNASWTTCTKPPIDVVLEPAWDEVVEIPEQGHWEYR